MTDGGHVPGLVPGTFVFTQQILHKGISMEHRYDPSYDRDEREERSRDRDRYRPQSRRDFQPGNYGQESGYGGQQSQYGQSQSGQGQYGQGQYGQGDYGRGQYGQSEQGGSFGQYSGFERGRDRDRDRSGEQRDYWNEQRDYWGEPSRSGSSSGYYRPGSSQSGGDLYGQRWGRGDWEPRERFGGESRWSDEQRWRSESQSFQRDRDREGWRGGRFGSEERGRDRPGFFQRLFKRGPKGYQRSDERLREDISERLMYAMEIDSSEVTVNVADGKVTLEGTVPDRYMKHAIEDLVDECPGVQDIDNRVRVTRDGYSSIASGASSTSELGSSTSSRTGASTSTTGSQSRRPS
jgi:hypothetical protein